MKKILSDELKKFFNIDKSDNVIKLAKQREIKTISGLVTLITSLNDTTTSPKEVAQQLEDIVVCILIKGNNATDLEKSLKNFLECYQEKLVLNSSEF